MPTSQYRNGALEQIILDVLTDDDRDWTLDEIIEHVQGRDPSIHRLEIRNAVIRLVARHTLQLTQGLTIRLAPNNAIPA